MTVIVFQSLVFLAIFLYGEVFSSCTKRSEKTTARDLLSKFTVVYFYPDLFIYYSNLSAWLVLIKNYECTLVMSNIICIIIIQILLLSTTTTAAAATTATTNNNNNCACIIYYRFLLELEKSWAVQSRQQHQLCSDGHQTRSSSVDGLSLQFQVRRPLWPRTR